MRYNSSSFNKFHERMKEGEEELNMNWSYLRSIHNYLEQYCTCIYFDDLEGAYKALKLVDSLAFPKIKDKNMICRYFETKGLTSDTIFCIDRQGEKRPLSEFRLVEKDGTDLGSFEQDAIDKNFVWLNNNFPLIIKTDNYGKPKYCNTNLKWEVLNKLDNTFRKILLELEIKGMLTYIEKDPRKAMGMFTA